MLLRNNVNLSLPAPCKKKCVHPVNMYCNSNIVNEELLLNQPCNFSQVNANIGEKNLPNTYEANEPEPNTESLRRQKLKYGNQA